MDAMPSNSYEAVDQHHSINDALSELKRLFIRRQVLSAWEFSERFAKAGWYASLLANSNAAQHKRKSLLFAALAKLVCVDSESVDALCYTVFARTGSLPGAKLLSQIVDDECRYDGAWVGPLTCELEEAFREAHSEIGGGTVLTSYQRSVQAALESDTSAVMSAPTSAGKSFVIHEYVKSRLRDGPFVSLFVVPTKALLSQVCAIYRRFAVEEEIDVAILSSVPDAEVGGEARVVLALTQERCIRLLDSVLVASLDFVFVDEIQSVESGDRGALLEYVVQQLVRRARTARFFGAGPFIEGAGELAKSLFAQECHALQTDDTPVSQLIVAVSPVKREKLLRLTIIDREGKAGDITVDVAQETSSYSRWKGSARDAVVESVYAFGRGAPCLVYAKGPATAETLARAYSDKVPAGRQSSEEFSGLIEFISESIHPRASLISCLKHKVAYHHSGMPDFVREEVEELFSEGEIDALFCTSTLLEGVNLPAERLFVVRAEKGDEEFSPFEFQNLIGRAGRLQKHLCGVVYCIQVPGETWVETFRKRESKRVEPAVQSKLRTRLAELSGILERGTAVVDPEVPTELRGTAVILRARHLQDPEVAKEYLLERGVNADDADALAKSLRNSLDSIQIPAHVALKSPFVDPILQNQLFNEVRSDVAEWRIRWGVGRATDFEKVFKKLDQIFGIMEEVDHRLERAQNTGNWRSVERSKLIRCAKMWLREKPFKDIVEGFIPANRRNAVDLSADEVDDVIRRTMERVSRGVAFVTAKYFSVLAEIVKYVIPEDEREEWGFVLAVPLMLELGCSDPRALALASACLPRAVAIRIGRLIPEKVEDPVGWLSANQSNNAFASLPAIYSKILKRCGIWE